MFWFSVALFLRALDCNTWNQESVCSQRKGWKWCLNGRLQLNVFLKHFYLYKNSPINKGVHYRIRTTPLCHFHHFKNCVRQFFLKPVYQLVENFFHWLIEFSTLTTIGCKSADISAALSRCLKMWKTLCACRLPYPKAIKNNLSSFPLYMFRGLNPFSKLLDFHFHDKTWRIYVPTKS